MMRLKQILLVSSLLVASTIGMAAPALACINPTGVVGQIIYNTDHNMMQFCNTTNWIAMGGGTDVTAANLDELADVNAGSPSDGQVLTWDNANSEWIAATTAGAGWQIPDDAAVCNAGTDGTIRYNSSKLQVCVNGTGWTDVAGSGVTNGKFVDGTNTADAVYTSGNVGVGTASPAAKLHVSNDQGGGTGQLLIDANVTSGYQTNLDITDIGMEFTTLSNIRGFAFNTGSTPTQKVIIKADGNVGIGTTSPAAKLHVDSGDVSARLSGSSVESTLWLSDDVNNLHWQYKYNISDNRLDFTHYNGSSWTIPMTIVSNGNVGMGTANPGYKLQVVDSTDITSGFLAGSRIDLITAPTANSSADTRAFIAENTSNGSGSNDIQQMLGVSFASRHLGTGILTNNFGMYSEGINQGTGTITTARGAELIAHNYSTGSIGTALGGVNTVQNRVGGNITTAFGAYNQSANVGTGTITNAYGSNNLVNNSSTGTITNAYGVTVDLNNPSGTVTNYYGVYVNDDAAQASNDAFAIYTAGSMQSYFGGNVGIGTTDPVANLDVAGVIYSDFLKIDQPDDLGNWAEIDLRSGYNVADEGYWNIAVPGNSGDFRIRNLSDARIQESVPFTIKENGNVGIGTTDPTQRLTVSGGLLEVRDGGDIMLRNAINNWDWRIQQNDQRLDFASGDTIGTPRMSLTHTGNVGIGATPNASAILDVTATDKGFLPPRMTQAQRDAISSPATGLMVFNTDTAQHDYFDGSNWVNISTGGGNGKFVDGTDTNDAVYTAGQVAIGTTTPDASSALEVSSTTQGFLPPRMTEAQRDAISSPLAGLMVFNTTSNRIEFYSGSGWVAMGFLLNGTDELLAASSCKNILDNGFSTGDGSYWIKPGSTAIQVFCDMTTDGGGYTYYPVTGGIQTYRSTDNNTCKTLGMDLAVPRTQPHLGAMISRYGSGYFGIVPGVSKPGGGGNYTSCIMRDPSTYGSGCSDWVAVDGGAWWLRNSTYNEPNGDYTADCWLQMTNHGNINDIRFNDLNCGHSATQYICSTNDK